MSSRRTPSKRAAAAATSSPSRKEENSKVASSPKITSSPSKSPQQNPQTQQNENKQQNEDKQQNENTHLLDFGKLYEIFKLVQIPMNLNHVSVGGVDVDLQFLFSNVIKLGGYEKVTASSKWKLVTKNINKDLESKTNQSIYNNDEEEPVNYNYLFKLYYQKYLWLYEKIIVQGVQANSAFQEWSAIVSKGGSTLNNQIPIKKKDEVLVINQSDIVKQQYRGPNPDEDGKDEKYLAGGFQNRLLLALRSPLPNEQDWAFNKLVKLSYQHHFFIGMMPGMSDVLVDHILPFFDGLKLNTSPTNFETTLVEGNQLLPDLSNPVVFYAEKWAMLFERALQSLHIIRNTSFMHENAILFARDHRLLTSLAKALALPTASLYTELQHYSLDIFENMANLIPLRGPSDFYLACVLKFIHGQDRSKILGGLRSLVKMAQNEKNSKIILGIDVVLIQRLVQLLLIPDEDLVVNILEFLYLFTNLSPDAGFRLASAVRFNILNVLFRFVHWRGQGYEVYRATINHQSKAAIATSQAKVNYAPPPKDPPSGLPPTAVDHFNAAMWIQTACERDAASSLSHIDFYKAYTDYCAHFKVTPILLLELLKLVAKMTSENAVSNAPPLILGLKPFSLPPLLDPTASSSSSVAKLESMTSADDSMQVDEPIGQTSQPAISSPAAAPPKIVQVSGNFCGFEECKDRDEYQTNSQLWDHVVSDHKVAVLAKNSSGTCPWKECSVLFESPNHFISHLKTHIPTAATNSNSANVAPTTPGRAKPKLVGTNTSIPASALQAHHAHFDPMEELKGVQLTALLVIRNLAKNPDNWTMFYPFEDRLACLLTSSKFGRLVASVFAELKG